jgi:RecB family exonuclease
MTYKEPWGFSKMETYQTCKKKFYYQYIEKLPSPGNAAMERGGKIHETIEAYLQGWITSMPEVEVDPIWVPRLDELKAKPNFTSEQAVGLDKQWRPLKDWFQKETWLRAKMDAKYCEDLEVCATDFKTGKYRVPSDEQLELYALVGLAQHPEATKARAEYWFIDIDDVYTKVFEGEELKKYKKKYEDFAIKLYTTEVWNEEPSRECKWCPYSKTRGGPCKY